MKLVVGAQCYDATPRHTEREEYLTHSIQPSLQNKTVTATLMERYENFARLIDNRLMYRVTFNMKNMLFFYGGKEIIRTIQHKIVFI